MFYINFLGEEVLNQKTRTRILLYQYIEWDVWNVFHYLAPLKQVYVHISV